MYIPLSPFFRKASSLSLRFYFHRHKKDGQDFLPILFCARDWPYLLAIKSSIFFLASSSVNCTGGDFMK